MFADRTEAIEKGCRGTGRACHSSVADLVLGGAPALGEEARSGEDVAGRIRRLASLAAALHIAQAAAMQRAHSNVGGDRLLMDRVEVSQ